MPTRPPIYRPPGHRTERQRKADIDKGRGTAAERGYDAAWRKLRAEFIAANPLCVDCLDQGRVTPTEEVDHVVSIRQRPDLRLVWSNLRALCRTHHSGRTAREQGFNRGKWRRR